jgi:hypothetical protein
MYLKHFNLPFKIDDLYEGFAESEGILSFDKDSLKIEFSTKDSLFGIIKSDLKKVNIPLNSISTIRYKKGFFGDKLYIVTNSLAIAQQLPGSEANEVELGIKKKNRQDAQVFASKINLLIAENRLDELENETI